MLRALEKYEILEEIGHGGMATVFRARDTRLDRLVALKVLHPHLRASPEAKSRFTREARSVAKLKHPNILEIYDYSGEESDESYIAAELLTGPTLKQLVEQGPELPAEVAICFAIQIARALDAAHAQGIVHRDVKPENVLVHDQACVKLADFGIAQIRDAGSFTATGQILGSPAHMAPEQVEAGTVDVRTDIFALGTVLYFLATSRLPFSGKNPHQVLRKVAEADFADPLRVRPSVGAPLAAVIRRAMSRDPEGRHASARELEEALEEQLADVGIEDADATLALYLTDPDGTARALRARVIPALIERGREAAARGDTRAALDRWNRVLALDDGNAEVLALVEGLSRRRPRRIAVATGALVTALAMAALLSARSRDDAASTAGAGAVGAAPSRVSSEVAGPAPTPPFPAAGSGAATSAGGAPSAGEVTMAGGTGPGSAAAGDPGTSGGASSPASGSGPTPAASGSEAHRLPRTRTVVFRPSPQNVRIGVDGAAPVPFGPAFQQVELEPGLHRFRVESGSGCCQDAEYAVRIPAGATPYVLSRTLPYRPARLYVVANVPADVRVGGGDGPGAEGRTREIVSVAMNGIEDVRDVTVRAPGYAPYTGTVRLEAGKLAEHTVRLQASAPAP